ncbi:Protein N-acetyltransferase, RimJ/RimL family [Lishizhenia tianjinensis]|uniref:Protein N-acetyltransferase, RimJ/RimL family n=1 Tax=Lishizhenia tianjinensis TaxID=477690 RepID=A0A1I6XMW7_9FLAO|nr:GNAT family N-acetyltransferase [Lishizhenia tianjinensis]SFT39715.1 Protein N-acetyltransferase, RimJ/RimL family [Lishizhenia tianjinensis]
MPFPLPRLEIKSLSQKDFPYFVELVTAPEIVNPVPHEPWSKEKIDENFKEFSKYQEYSEAKSRAVWGIFEQGKKELIGLCALLRNDEDQPEIGYRFRKKYWGKGYATELTQGMIHYCFKNLGLELVTADVNIENIGSVKVLEKCFTPVREFYNERDKSTDRRYQLLKEDYNTLCQNKGNIH